MLSTRYAEVLYCSDCDAVLFSCVTDSIAHEQGVAGFMCSLMNTFSWKFNPITSSIIAAMNATFGPPH